MGHVKSGLNGTSIGIVSFSKEILVELFVEIIDSVIEGEEDELGNLIGGITTGNVSASAVTILKIKIIMNITYSINI